MLYVSFLQALKTVRKDSFKKAAKDLDHAGSVVERIGGPDRVHDIVQVGGGLRGVSGQLYRSGLRVRVKP